MNASRNLYISMLIAIVGIVLYVLYANFIYDPQAEQFLSQKEGLKREVAVTAWLNAMYVHVIFACAAMVSGAINFSNKMLRRYPTFHRMNGYIYAASVLAVVLTSGYMAPYATGGKLTSIPFNLLNIIWPGLTLLAIIQIKKKQIHKHRQWMVRSYAFCFTNLFIHFFEAIFYNGFGFNYKMSYVLGVYCSIGVLFLLGELVIRTMYRTPPKITMQPRITNP